MFYKIDNQVKLRTGADSGRPRLVAAVVELGYSTGHCFIQQHDIRSRFPAFEPGRIHQVRAAATFTLPAGGGSRLLSDAFVERVFPLRERTQTIVRQIRF